MTTLELVLIIILYIVIGLLSIKPILKVSTSETVTVFDRVITAFLIIFYPVFWAIVTLVAVVFIIREFIVRISRLRSGSKDGSSNFQTLF